MGYPPEEPDAGPLSIPFGIKDRSPSHHGIIWGFQIMPSGSAIPPLDGPSQASRVKGFAAFFKSYMSVWTLVVAALPIPVGAFKLIPTFESQRSYLSVYTSLFCFLSLGFIFFERHRLGGYLFASTGKWKRSNLFIRNFP